MGLADVMEQGHHGHAVIRDVGHDLAGGVVLPAVLDVVPLEQSPHGIQYIEAVLKQTAGCGEVVLGAGRCGVEVAFLDVLQELVHTGTLDLAQLRLESGDVLFDVHCVSSFKNFCPQNMHRSVL
jgi:hypothetical protein